MEIKYLDENFNYLRDEAEKLLLEFVDTTGEFTQSAGGGGKTADRVSSFKKRKRKRFSKSDQDRDIFSGEIYKRKSRLKKRKFDLFKKARKTPLKGKLGEFEPVFIIGYQLRKPDLVFELWYDAVSGKYALFDKFGGSIGSMEDKLEDAIEQLVDVIAKEEEVAVRDTREFERETEREAERSIKRKGYSKADLDFDRFFDSIQLQKDADYIQEILNENISSKEFLFRAINDEIEEYHETKVKRRQVSKLFQPILGRELEYPSKFLPGENVFGRLSQKVRKVFGKEKEATFVIGFTFADKIDMEIWFVKESKGNVFYVFDLNSGRIIGKQIKSLRHAYQVLAKKLALPEDTFKDVELRR